MKSMLVSRLLPHLLQLAVAAAGFVGAADVLAFVAGAGGGKGTAAVVLFGPLLLLGKPLSALVPTSGPGTRQWVYLLMLVVAMAPSLIALVYTRAEFGVWIHPSWF